MINLHLKYLCIIEFAWWHWALHPSIEAVPLCDVTGVTVEHEGKCFLLTSSNTIQSDCQVLCQQDLKALLVDEGYQLQSNTSTNLSQWIMEEVNLAEGLDSSDTARICKELLDKRPPTAPRISHAFIGYKWIGRDIYYSNDTKVEPDLFADLTNKQFKLSRCLRYLKGKGLMWSFCTSNATTVCTCQGQSDAHNWNTSVVQTVAEDAEGTYTTLLYAMTTIQRTSWEANLTCISLNCTMFTLQSVDKISVVERLLDALPTNLEGEFKRVYIGYHGNKEAFYSFDNSTIPSSVYQYLYDLFGKCLRATKTFIDNDNCNHIRHCMCMVDNVDLFLSENPRVSSVNIVTVNNTYTSDVTLSTVGEQSSTSGTSEYASTLNDLNSAQSRFTHAATDFSLTECTCPCSITQQVNNPPPTTTNSQTGTNQLKVDKKELSSFKRAKTCANDERESSKYMGVTAAIVMSSVFFVIVLNDSITICCFLLRRFSIIRP